MLNVRQGGGGFERIILGIGIKPFADYYLAKDDGSFN